MISTVLEREPRSTTVVASTPAKPERKSHPLPKAASEARESSAASPLQKLARCQQRQHLGSVASRPRLSG